MKNIEASNSFNYISLPGHVPESSIDRWEEGSVNFENLRTTLAKDDIELKGGRELLSSGFNGPIFKLDTDNGPVVEKTFIKGGARKMYDVSLGKRLQRDVVQLQSSFDKVHPRLGVVNPETGKVDEVIIDWVYNEERALKNLQGIDGIPKYIAVVYENLKGSILEEYIPGYDILEISNHINTTEEIDEVFSRLKLAYKQAAEKGFLLNNPGESTIMVNEKTKQPYLVDWYNHQRIDLKDKNSKAMFEQGLKELDEMEAMILKLMNFSNVKNKIAVKVDKAAETEH